MITPRQAFLTLEYDGTDISSDIRKDVENFNTPIAVRIRATAFPLR